MVRFFHEKRRDAISLWLFNKYQVYFIAFNKYQESKAPVFLLLNYLMHNYTQLMFIDFIADILNDDEDVIPEYSARVAKSNQNMHISMLEI